MTTATETAPEPATAPIPRETGAIDTGPQAVLELAEQENLSYRDIARRLHISPATVTRRVREGMEARQTQRKQVFTAAILLWLSVLATIMTAAVCCIAWA